MFNKIIYKLLFVSIIPTILFINPVYGIAVSVSMDNSVALSENLNLGHSASLAGTALLNEGNILHELKAKGYGNNKIEETVGGVDYSISNRLESLGNFGISSSSAASAKSGIISQNIEMSGDVGYIATSATSLENDMIVAGGFRGTGGSLNSDLSSFVGNRAKIDGKASIAGVECLDDNILGVVASNDIAMSAEGLYTEEGHKKTNSDLGYFGLFAMNTDKRSVNAEDKVQSSQNNMVPNYIVGAGDQNSYKLSRWRWNTINPRIKMYLRNDANLQNEGLTAATVSNSVTVAALTWEAASSQNLFADTNTVEISTTKTADKYDGYNVVAFKPLSSVNALACTKTYYALTKVGGYYSAKESDISFNTQYNWGTSGTGSNYDVQTVAQHELGHTLGLGDIYGTSLQSDTKEVMNYYTGVKRSLGNGDKTGVWALYG